jgi:hypothetical protein
MEVGKSCFELWNVPTVQKAMIEGEKIKNWEPKLCILYQLPTEDVHSALYVFKISSWV